MVKISRNIPLLAVITLLTMALTGCGYKMMEAKSSSSNNVSASPRPVYLENLKDMSRTPLYGAFVRRELARRTLERADVALKKGSKALLLTVTLSTLVEEPRAFTGEGHPAEYLLKNIANISVHEGKELLLTSTINVRREFATGTNVSEIRLNKERAMKFLAEDLAGQILRRIYVAKLKGNKK
jgi:outer membrane lipopolysaccharide assembly protein LptE/RlpB